ncbi:ABC transporter substrate-binding protein [Basilea psittacipulmonis]|uniref:ABC transporter substrate-binding protein n=1 Tax=Basilea psittacipulmonis DSM 24701 TaxID=1072685 RepID=A0A077DH75_9BURK|nr:ABC transporter substrate-binding protein [Basilea psittacipulmonis]AIL32812.1 ABC transporter substrate-binding protein [Basilea psittacipulmonis DSM 24701]
MLLKRSLLLLTGLLSLSLIHPVAQAKEANVKVAAIVQHPALDAARDGVKDKLAEHGYVEGKNLKWEYQNAQGNTSIAVQIARQFVGGKPDVIVAIATPMAQAAASSTKNIPIVFAAVSNPVAAGLVKDWETPGKNITGVSDKLEIEQQIALIKEILPSIQTLGVVYNPGEANSVAAIKTLEEVLPKHNIKLVTAAAPRTVDVQSAARSLIGKIDMFYTTTDNNVVAAYESMAKVANEAKIPLVASDTPSVERGAVASLGVNYYHIGLQAGEMVYRILQGEKPANIPIETDKHPELHINLKAAQEQGITLPQSLIDRASKVLQ